MSQVFNVIGLMSGTSLDGLDIAYCQFKIIDNAKIDFTIIAAETIAYAESIKQAFIAAETSTTLSFIAFDRKIGTYFGNQVQLFLQKHKLKNPDFVSSHGHTIFHDPANGYTVQIGHGANLAAAAKIPVVSDFRSLDVALGGQGAPLVPIGDFLLFNDYSHCLNLGGIANISYQKQEKRIAFDICACNIPLNFLANKVGFEYDKNGAIARSGTVDDMLLHQLNNLPYFSQNPPKSLGKEWVESQFLPLILASKSNTEDILATVVEHIAINIAKEISGTANQLYITGGGAFNTYLVERIKINSAINVIIPDENIVKFKEALIFALLGLLRWTNQTNTLKTVTGASKDSIGGSIYIN